MSREMKDSGIEWIGKIPSEWNIAKIKQLGIKLKSGGTPTSTNNKFYSDKGIPWVAIGDMTDFGYIENTSKCLSDDGIKDKNLIKFTKGTILYSIYATVGRVTELGIDATINQAILALTNIININKQFLKYNLKAMEKYIISESRGNTQFNLNSEKVNNFYILNPNIKQQTKIANFLDKKCLIIDKAIEGNKKSIEQMKEYKNKLIEKIVTIGINNNEFNSINHYSISKIPKAWIFNKTIYTLDIPITDGPHETPNLYDEGIAFISADAIKNGKIDFKRKRGYISQEDYEIYCKKYTPKLNDIYMIKSGATTGNIGIVENDKIKFNIWSPLAVFRANKDIMNFKYLYYLLQSSFYKKQVELNWSFGTQQNIGMRVLEQLKILIPPLAEQQQIADYLDKKCLQIDKVISKRKELIEKLEEYKKSLIYEAITGKIEV